MASWSNQTKNTSSYSQLSKSTSTWRNEVGPGKTWLFGGAGLKFGSETDESGSPVYFGQIGTGQSWTYLSKN